MSVRVFGIYVEVFMVNASVTIVSISNRLTFCMDMTELYAGVFSFIIPCLVNKDSLIFLKAFKKKMKDYSTSIVVLVCVWESPPKCSFLLEF